MILASFTPPRSSDWDRSLKGAALSWTTGTPRPLRLAELLEEGGWLRALRQVSGLIFHAKWRLYEPAEAKWVEGQALSFEERRTQVLRELRDRCAQLAVGLGMTRELFRERVRLLLELSEETTAPVTPGLTRALQDDLRTVATWASYLYDVTLPTLDHEVGYVDTRSGRTILDVLKPVQMRARKTAHRTLEWSIERFNNTMKPVVIDAAAIEEFLQFLDRMEIWAWYLHVEEVALELRQPTDVQVDRVFSGLRSIAIVTEQVLVEIARELRSDGAVVIAERDLKEALRVLIKQRNGWRAEVWGWVERGWSMTRDRRLGLQERVARITDPVWLRGSSPEAQAIALTILTYVALRHFGSHRHAPTEVQDFERLSTLFHAATHTAVFCWKLAADGTGRVYAEA